MNSAALMMFGGWLGHPVPSVISTASATANLDGTIDLSWTLPVGTTHAYIRYNVDQAAAPATPALGIEIGLVSGSSYSFSDVTYGADYKFSIWSSNSRGLAQTAKTLQEDGPLNPLVYSENLELWLDARRETAYSAFGSIETPQDFSGSGIVPTQATSTRRPLYMPAIFGVNGMPAFAMARASNQCWEAGDNAMHNNTRGLTFAAIASTSDVAVAESIIAKYETTGDKRQYNFGKLAAGGYVIHMSGDGTSAEYDLVGVSASNDTGDHTAVATWEPGAGAKIYTDAGDKDETDMGWSSLAGTDAALRIGAQRSQTNDNWAGVVVMVLAWSQHMRDMNGEMLGEALEDMAGL